jgi:hypothetical protein
MLIKNITESMTSNRIEWRKTIHVTDPDSVEDQQSTPEILGLRLGCYCNFFFFFFPSFMELYN